VIALHVIGSEFSIMPQDREESCRRPAPLFPGVLFHAMRNPCRVDYTAGHFVRLAGPRPDSRTSPDIGHRTRLGSRTFVSPVDLPCGSRTIEVGEPHVRSLDPFRRDLGQNYPSALD